jgi:hypothetical protein
MHPMNISNPSHVNQMNITVNLDPYLSLKALASYSGLSVRALRSFLIDPLKPLPHYRVGGRSWYGGLSLMDG